METIQADQIVMGLILNAGDAKQHIYQALEYAKKGDEATSNDEIKLAEHSLTEAHNIQSAWLAREAGGEKAEITALFVHAQDHLMTTMTEVSLIKEIIELKLELLKK